MITGNSFMAKTNATTLVATVLPAPVRQSFDATKIKSPIQNASLSILKLSPR